MNKRGGGRTEGGECGESGGGSQGWAVLGMGESQGWAVLVRVTVRAGQCLAWVAVRAGQCLVWLTVRAGYMYIQYHSHKNRHYAYT